MKFPHLPMLLLLAVPPLRAAEPQVWLAKDAPYRALVTPGEAPGDARAGWLIELPEFGATRPDTRDLYLAGDNKEVALDPVWRGEGRSVRLLAEAMPEGKPVHLYFGHGARRLAVWKAERSLVLETRRRPDAADCKSFAGWQAAWQASPAVDGIGFVNNIFLGENPFGPPERFLSHFSGLLGAPSSGPVEFYSLSNQQSYLLVDRKPVLAWKEGRESSRDPRSMVTGSLALKEGAVVRVDYHHAMDDGNNPGMVLGWKRDGKYETIPRSAWIHPGRTDVGPVESLDGLPVPLAAVRAVSYLGYADQWYVEARLSAPDLPDGWVAEWLWPDNVRASGRETTRLIFGLKPVLIGLRLRRGDQVIEGRRVLDIPREMPAATIHDKDHLARYLGLLDAEDPAHLAEPARMAGYLLARDFAGPEQAAKWAAAWLEVAKTGGDEWISAQRAVTRWQARGDARAALDQLRAMPADHRAAMGHQWQRMELELLACRLQDPGTPAVVAKLQGNPDSPLARLARVRLGDYQRLSGRPGEARAAYLSASDSSPEAIRKGPTIDKAAALAIEGHIKSGRVPEARGAILKWETSRPLAKLEGDQLLWSARVHGLDGDWAAAAKDLESCLAVRPNCPEEIEVSFWLARAYFETKRRDQARELWQAITRDYPKHERAASAAKWLKK